jgi:hypothetical protein
MYARSLPAAQRAVWHGPMRPLASFRSLPLPGHDNYNLPKVRSSSLNAADCVWVASIFVHTELVDGQAGGGSIRSQQQPALRNSCIRQPLSALYPASGSVHSSIFRTSLDCQKPARYVIKCSTLTVAAAAYFTARQLPVDANGSVMCSSDVLFLCA